MKKSRTQQALDMLRANPGMSHYGICKIIGLSQSALSRAVKREEEKARRALVLQRGGYYEPN
jgi:predicted transcriptional regulator